MFSANQLKDKALAMGFNLVGITRAVPSPMVAAYERWLEVGMHGTMGYLARPDRQARRRDLNVILPGVRSMIIIGVDYRADLVPQAILQDPAHGRIASYAWGLDYHDSITPRLEELASWLRVASGQALTHRVYVDTGALLERSHAQQAGMGFIGKNTMLIHPRRGSYFCLGEILTDLEFDTYDTPHKPTMCGTCTRCLSACPTDAFPQPHVLDARRCISYLTIEHKGWIERALRPLMGNWVFGCDVCQEVCPFQRFSTHQLPLSMYGEGAGGGGSRAAPLLLDLLALDDARFKERFYGTPVYRIKRERLVRNACVATGNWGYEDAIAPLACLLEDASPLVRGHAVWALGEIRRTAKAQRRQREEVEKMLRALRERETDADVRGEIAAALAYEDKNHV
jgi:epoxyqueuosine reductase